MKIIYVAGKYNGKTYSEIDDNIRKAEEVSIKLLAAGWCVITPHKNYSHYEIYGAVYESLDYKLFMQCDLEILSRCDALFAIEGWLDSPGAGQEIYLTKKKNIPIFYEHNGTPNPDDLK